MDAMVAVATPEYFEEKIKEAGLWYEKDLVDETEIAPNILAMVTSDIASRFQVVPIKINEADRLVLVAYSEQSFKDTGQIEQVLGRPVTLLFAEEENVKNALSHYFNINGSTGFKRRVEITEIDITPLKRKINGMIQDAIKKHASDIHLLPSEDGMQITFRISGHLLEFSTEYTIRKEEIPNVINIIKGLDTSGQTDVGRQNMPNQGSFLVHHGDLSVDSRLSTVPANRSQKVNLRLLPQLNSRIVLSQQGYTEQDLRAFRTVLLRASSGMFLVVGPTGSGKTTSLYAQIYDVLDMVGEPLNVMTIEDPVEIYEPRFCQVQVRRAKEPDLDLTAEKIFKVGLRQDPDIFLYGEIRDKKDAEVAIEAAITGHRLFSTVHAKDCIAAIARLLDLGVSRSSLLQELNLIISQRLVGVLCPHCSKEHTLTDLERMALDEEEIRVLTNPKVKLRERGTAEAVKKCPHCSNGYVRRVAVAEYVVFNMAIRDALLDNVNFTGIHNLLQKHGFQSMWRKGLAMVARGQTDLKEVLHVIGKS